MKKDPRYPDSLYLQTVAEGMLFVDPPKHTRLRGLVSRHFTARAISESLSSISDLVVTAAADLSDKGDFDIVSDYADRIPVRVICDVLGLPEADYPNLVRWTHDASLGSNPTVPQELLDIAELAAVNFVEYAAALAEERRSNPGEDMISAMVSATEDGDLLSSEEFAAQLMTLIAAGTETTISLIGTAMVNLERWPDERTCLRNDPSLDENAVEEFLRFDPPAQLAFPRIVLEPLEIGGVQFDAGDLILPMLASANRDPEIVPDPDVLDIDRTRPAGLQQLSFGGGIHFCLGAQLARYEGRVALRTLLDRFPNLEVNLSALKRGGNPMIRGYSSVPATTGALV